MSGNLLKKYFPPPIYMIPHSFGVDISDESIKFIEIIPSAGEYRVNKFGERRIPKGVIESGKIKDLKKMEEIISSLKNEEKIESVRVSLPEEQMYIFENKLEKNELENIKDAIEFSIEEYVPIPAQEVLFDYEILDEDEKNITVQVSAVTNTVVEEYLSVFRNSSINVQSLELEAQAISRSIIKKGDPETYMIVDFGEKRSGIFIVSNGIVVFTSTLDLGGGLITNMIEKNFKIDSAEAEKMKKQYGLRRNTGNNEIFSVILNSVSNLRDEIVKHYIYWHTHKYSNKEHSPIKKIILCGGDSNLIGLPEYLSASTKSPVETANVWTNVTSFGENIPEITFEKSLSYAAAIGLALGNFEYD